MTHFIYTAWFRDPGTHPDEQDHEWPACIRIHAETLAGARDWGDALALERSRRPPLAVFLHSTIEEEAALPNDRPNALPTIAEGQDASADYIGW